MTDSVLLFGKAWLAEKAAPAPAARRGPPKFPVPRAALRAPGQRLKDHGARNREAEWRAYQAAWQKPIDQLECSAERFYQLRRNVLNLNRKQAARVLRATVNSVLNWEHGVHPVPFYAFLALLLISESQHYRLANEAWRDWEFIEGFNARPARAQGFVTCLVNRQTGAYFEPEHLNNLHHIMQKLALLESQNFALRTQVEALTRENTEIRELYRVDGVTGQLHEMREHLQALISRVNTAAVLPLKKAAGSC